MSTFHLSVDLEEYYHAANIAEHVSNNPASRVVESTHKLLELFSETNTKATFFVLAEVAEQHPTLIKEIEALGHPIESHGYQHISVYERTQAEFALDIKKSKDILENITGKEISAYRAPNFSISDKTPWAWDELAKAGFKCDSSIYPVYHDRYKNISQSRIPFTDQASGLRIIPLATKRISLFSKSLNLPIAGGAYWRVLPMKYTLWGLNSCDIPRYCYLHPWEIDPGQPKVKTTTKLKTIRHYTGLSTFTKRLKKILNQHNFTPYPYK